jgi:hypothetical protein
MILSLDDAMLVLNKWKQDGVTLEVKFSADGVDFSARARVSPRSGGDVLQLIEDSSMLLFRFEGLASSIFDFDTPLDASGAERDFEEALGLEHALGIVSRKGYSLSLDERRLLPTE